MHPGAILREIRFYLNYLRTLPAYLCICTSPNREIIRMDLERWYEIVYPMIEVDSALNAKHLLPKLNWMLIYKQEYRNLLLYRLRIPSSVKGYFHYALTRLFWKPIDSLYLSCDDIGPGFFIQHGFSCMVCAERIGKNCWVNQQVTIGYRGDEFPILEDNVAVHSGAQVLGGITMHRNSEAGAGAVVVHDVPENAIVVGVPAKILKYKQET